MGFEKHLALRYLRSKRRYGFVSAITILAGMGVAVGVMAMIVALAVMDGFEEDLKQKLLGNMAPITIDLWMTLYRFIVGWINIKK